MEESGIRSREKEEIAKETRALRLAHLTKRIRIKSEIMDIEDDEDPHHMRDNRRNTNINAMNEVHWI